MPDPFSLPAPSPAATGLPGGPARPGSIAATGSNASDSFGAPGCLAPDSLGASRALRAARGDAASSEARAALLGHGGAGEVLARIVDGDPLGVRPLVRLGLRRRALVLDADRVHLRALARIASEAPLWRGRPPLERWLAARVDEAIEDLRRAPLAPGPAAPPGSLAELAPRLGLGPRAVLAGLAAFHRLPLADREAFFFAVLEGRGLDATARHLRLPFPEAARALRRCLVALLGRPPGAADPGPSGDRP